MPVRIFLKCLIFGVVVAGVASGQIGGQSSSSLSSVTAAPATPIMGGSGYNQPPKNILDVMHAPSPPVPVVSPTQDTILLVTWQTYPPISRVATPFLRLAGVRVEPKNHSEHDTPGGYGITPCATNFDLVHIADSTQIPVKLPSGACSGRPIWSADGKRFAFVNIASEAVELWIGDAMTGEIHQMSGARLNPMFGDDVQWMPDQKTLLVKLVPQGMGAPPPEPIMPIGPSIQETDGEKGQSSTYETRDTLGSKYDEDLFDYYAASQLAFVDATTAEIMPMGEPGNYRSLSPAPDGRHILVTAIHKPYSYITTYDRFPQEAEVWDVSERSHVQIHTIASLPLADRVPIDGVPLGPRRFSWRATEAATLVWAEALDGGDWNANVPARDKIMLSKAPFNSPAVEITRTEQRYNGILWSDQPSIALLGEWDRNRHWQRSFVIDVDDQQRKPRLLWDLSIDEHYADPGHPVMRQLANGALVIRQEGDSIYLAGSGSSPDGDRPFLDRLNLNTLKSERLFRSDKTCYEWFLSFAGSDTQRFLTWHQSPADPPNVFARTL
jgi:dipeptidyl aminopeptidase/acylaminoacyl peptidase